MTTHKLWARVGCTIYATEEEAKQIADNPEQFMAEALLTGRAKVDGDTYFPEDVNENIDYEMATNQKITS